MIKIFFSLLLAVCGCCQESAFPEPSVEGSDTGIDTGQTSSNDNLDCAFPVDTAGGNQVAIGNELEVKLSPETPTGNQPTGYQEVLRFQITPLHPECLPLTFDRLHVSLTATDKADSNWVTNVENVDIRDLGQPVADNGYPPLVMSDALSAFGDYQDAWPQGNWVIDPVVSYTLAVYMDTSGASTKLHDTLNVTLEQTFYLAGVDYTFPIHIDQVIKGDTLSF